MSRVAQPAPGAVVWLTGLPGAGKSTIARALEKELFRLTMNTYVLDGDHCGTA